MAPNAIEKFATASRIDLDWKELRGFSNSLLQISLLLLLLSIAYLFFGDVPPGYENLYVGFVLLFAATVFGLRLVPALRREPRIMLTLETLAMTFFVTAAASITGAGDSVLLNLFVLPLIVAALALGKRATIWLLLLILACQTGLIVWSEASNESQMLQGAALVFRFAPILLITFLTTLLAENMRLTREKITSISERDDLTELYNMRAFAQRLGALHLTSVRHEQPYSVIMIDIDNLKPVNDEYGHEAGNRAIQLVGSAIIRCIRASDIAARFGGDEFVVLLPQSDSQSAEQAVRRIRNSIFATTLKIGSQMIRLTVSMGVATMGKDGNETNDLLAAADRAMYEDKAFRRTQNRLPASTEVASAG